MQILKISLLILLKLTISVAAFVLMSCNQNKNTATLETSKSNNANEITDLHKVNDTLKVPESEDLVDLLKADDSWGKEIITFPIDWAPKVTLEGFEELRFAPEWSNSKHDDFWSLVMAWKVNASSEITLKDIKTNLEGYFDGLMIPNHWSQEFPKPKLNLFAFPKTESNSSFKGLLTLFDGFHTGKLITLNILGEQQLCKTKGNSIIVFRFSPKAYGQSIWNELHSISIKDDICSD